MSWENQPGNSSENKLSLKYLRGNSLQVQVGDTETLNSCGMVPWIKVHLSIYVSLKAKADRCFGTYKRCVTLSSGSSADTNCQKGHPSAGSVIHRLCVRAEECLKGNKRLLPLCECPLLVGVFKANG